MLKESTSFNGFADALDFIYRKRNCYNVPYSISFNEKDYWKHIAKYKNKVLEYADCSYLVIKHKHKDFYVHETRPNLVDKILQDGYLLAGGEENCLGKGVYTFPLYSGRFSSLYSDSKYLVFEANEEHCHVVGTDDSNHELGEADFLVDKLEINKVKVYSLNEIERLVENCFANHLTLKDYYGIDYEGEVNYHSLCEIVTSLN